MGKMIGNFVLFFRDGKTMSVNAQAIGFDKGIVWAHLATGKEFFYPLNTIEKIEKRMER